MGEHTPREAAPRHTQDLPPATKPTGDMHSDTVRAIDTELTSDLTYKAGARPKSAGSKDQMAGAKVPAPGSKNHNASRAQKPQNSVAGARAMGSAPIIPPGIQGIPPTGNLYLPLAELGTNQNQSLQVGNPLQQRTTSRERRKRRSLDNFVNNV